MRISRYDVDQDRWTPIAGLPNQRARSQHASVRHGNTIIVSGGLDADLALDSILVYHPNTDIWETSPRRMPTPRVDHVTLSHGDKVYFCGGWQEVDHGEVGPSRSLIETIDVYDVERDAWSVETTVPTPRFHAGFVIVKGKLYIIGGFHSDTSLFDRATGKRGSFLKLISRL